MPRHLSFPFVLSFACLMLVSCATVKQPSLEDEQIKAEPADWLFEQEKRQQISTWEIRGRLGVQTEYDGGSLDIIWKQSENDYSIRLMAPLGAGSYLVQGDNELAEIRFPDGEKKIVNNIDDIFASTLEVDLPATAVKDWIRGLPARALPIEQISWNEHGLPERIKQSGWNVELKKYTGTEILLPHAIYISRDDDAELDIRLLLRQWLIDNQK